MTQNANHQHADTHGWFPWTRTRGSKHPAFKAADDNRTTGERVADNVASFGGSWPFIFIFLGLIAVWIVGNTLLLQHALHHKAFDPYPYIALNLVLSALAGLQAPIIMMSQNRAAARDEALAAHHYHETSAINGLLESNTDLTTKVHALSQQIHTLTERLCAGSGPLPS